MNKVILMGRSTRDPEVRYSADGMAIARFSVAIDRSKDGADFPSVVAFGKSGEFAEKYIKKGTKILVEGRLQTGSYEDKDGKRIYTTDVVADRFEFCESKASNADNDYIPVITGADDFMKIPIDDSEFPFE